MAARSCLAKGEAGAREGRRVSIATDLNSTLLISPCLSKSEARELFFADPSSMEYEETPSPERAQFEETPSPECAQFAPADVYAARAAELDAARAAACASAVAAARRAADRSMARSKLLAQQDDDAENTPPQRSPAVSPSKLLEQQSPLSTCAVLEPLTRAQREERDIEALSVDELKQRIVATARRRRERRAQLQVAEAYVY